MVKIHRIDAHVIMRWATEEHQDIQQVDQASKIAEAQLDLDCQCNDELFIVWGFMTPHIIKEEMQHIDGPRLRGGHNYGHSGAD